VLASAARAARRPVTARPAAGSPRVRLAVVYFDVGDRRRRATVEKFEVFNLEKMLDAQKKMTPKTGANLVGVDDFETAGEELYFCGHFATVAEAEAEKARRLEKDPDEVLHVYPADPDGEYEDDGEYDE
jgi:hypothetical protein